MADEFINTTSAFQNSAGRNISTEMTMKQGLAIRLEQVFSDEEAAQLNKQPLYARTPNKADMYAAAKHTVQHGTVPQLSRPDTSDRLKHQPKPYLKQPYHFTSRDEYESDPGSEGSSHCHTPPRAPSSGTTTPEKDSQHFSDTTTPEVMTSPTSSPTTVQVPHTWAQYTHQQQHKANRSFQERGGVSTRPPPFQSRRNWVQEGGLPTLRSTDRSQYVTRLENDAPSHANVKHFVPSLPSVRRTASLASGNFRRPHLVSRRSSLTRSSPYGSETVRPSVPTSPHGPSLDETRDVQYVQEDTSGQPCEMGPARHLYGSPQLTRRVSPGVMEEQSYCRPVSSIQRTQSAHSSFRGDVRWSRSQRVERGVGQGGYGVRNERNEMGGISRSNSMHSYSRPKVSDRLRRIREVLDAPYKRNGNSSQLRITTGEGYGYERAYGGGGGEFAGEYSNGRKADYRELARGVTKERMCKEMKREEVVSRCDRCREEIRTKDVGKDERELEILASGVNIAPSVGGWTEEEVEEEEVERVGDGGKIGPLRSVRRKSYLRRKDDEVVVRQQVETREYEEGVRGEKNVGQGWGSRLRRLSFLRSESKAEGGGRMVRRGFIDEIVGGGGGGGGGVGVQECGKELRLEYGYGVEGGVLVESIDEVGKDY